MKMICPRKEEEEDILDMEGDATGKPRQGRLY
jgi:hypothetical protein